MRRSRFQHESGAGMTPARAAPALPASRAVHGLNQTKIIPMSRGSMTLGTQPLRAVYCLSDSNQWSILFPQTLQHGGIPSSHDFPAVPMLYTPPSNQTGLFTPTGYTRHLWPQSPDQSDPQEASAPAASPSQTKPGASNTSLTP